MKKIIFFGVILFILLLLFNFGLVSAQATETGNEEDYCLVQITLFDDGSALVIGSATTNPNIKDIEYENESLYGLTQLLTSKQQGKWSFNIN